MSRSSARRRASGPVSISRALDNFSRTMGIDRPLAEYGILTGWAELVGEQIAKVSAAQRIENGVLIVAVSSAPWRAELTMRRNEIKEKINARAGKNIVRDIRFR